MASEKQLAANRANAKYSTGPKTNAGKSRSRMNAWKHGLTAEKVVIDGEDAQELEAIRQELWEEYQPEPGMERLVVERLALTAWRLRRAPTLESSLLRSGNSVGSLGYADGVALAHLIRYEAGLTNAFQRTLQLLIFLQDRRREKIEGAVIEDERAPDQAVSRLLKPPIAAE